MYGESPQFVTAVFRVAADFRKHTKTSPQIFLNVANTFLHALKEIGTGRFWCWATIDLGRHPQPASKKEYPKSGDGPGQRGWGGDSLP